MRDAKTMSATLREELTDTMKRIDLEPLSWGTMRSIESDMGRDAWALISVLDNPGHRLEFQKRMMNELSGGVLHQLFLAWWELRQYLDGAGDLASVNARLGQLEEVIHQRSAARLVFLRELHEKEATDEGIPF